MSSDMMRLIKIVLEYHETKMLKWSSKRFTDQLLKFREKSRVRFQNYLNDYSQIGPISDKLAEYQFYSSSSSKEDSDSE